MRPFIISPIERVQRDCNRFFIGFRKKHPIADPLLVAQQISKVRAVLKECFRKNPRFNVFFVASENRFTPLLARICAGQRTRSFRFFVGHKHLGLISNFYNFLFSKAYSRKSISNLEPKALPKGLIVFLTDANIHDIITEAARRHYFIISIGNATNLDRLDSTFFIPYNITHLSGVDGLLRSIIPNVKTRQKGVSAEKKLPTIS